MNDTALSAGRNGAARPGGVVFSLLRGLAVVAIAANLASCQRPGQALKPVPSFPGAALPSPAPQLPNGNGQSEMSPPLVVATDRNEVPAFDGQDSISFGKYSDSIDAAALPILDAQVAWLIRYPTARVIVEGYSDNQTSAHFAFALAERRANAVRRHFLSRGVQSGRIQIVAFGKDRRAGNAIASNRIARSVFLTR